MTESERDAVLVHLQNKMDAIESHLLDLLIPHRKEHLKAMAQQQTPTAKNLPAIRQPVAMAPKKVN